VHQMKLKTKAMLIFEAKRIIVVEIENWVLSKYKRIALIVNIRAAIRR
jgi:hypothetical protein